MSSVSMVVIVTLMMTLPPKVEMLPDIAHAPRILPNYAQHIPANLKKVSICNLDAAMLVIFYVIGSR